MKKHFPCLLILVMFLLTTLLSIPVLSQTNEVVLRIAAITPQGIAFFEQGANGFLQPIGEPLANFAVESLGGTADWLILSEKSFAASPDGQLIAFTAKHENEATLFLYTVSSNSLIQHPISSYWLVPQWSPDSEAILLKPSNPYWNGLPLPNDFVYEVATNSLFQITYTEGRETAFQWSPDGDSLLYLGTCHPQTCGNPTRDIYVISRDGSSRFPITDFPKELPPDTYIDVCYIEWDAISARWYYVIGCGGIFDNPFTFLYSTDIHGNNQLEVDTEAHLRTREAGDITFNYGIIKGVHPRPEGVYFSVEFSFYPDIDLHPDMANVSQNDWRVLRLNRSGQLETVYQQLDTLVNGSGTELTGSVISPDGQKMVLLFNSDRAFVIDVANNQNIGAISGLTEPDQHAVCDVSWVDNDTIIYNMGGRTCQGVDTVQSQAVWMLNGVTNEVTILTEGLAELAWLLPITEVTSVGAGGANHP